MNPKVVSIYSGGGGIDIGFENAGYQTVFLSDIWDIACDTLKDNFRDSEIICDNITNLNFKSLKDNHRVIDVLVGGPPCPPFSKSRFYIKEKKRGIDDVDGYLTVSEYFRAVKELKPKVFLFENVHGFVYKPHQSAYDLLKKFSKDLGYNITTQVINTADFGIPQTRERFFCVGVKDGLNPFIFPKKTHSKKPEDESLKPWVTAGEVLSDLDYDLPEDINMQAGSKHKDLLKLVPPGDNYLFFTEKRGYPKPIFKWRSRYWSFLLKLSKDRPSWTIQASHSNNMGPFHWKNRFLRIDEIKRIQTFPDNYKLRGTYKEQWRQIGNAVPPLMMELIAKQIKKVL